MAEITIFDRFIGSTNGYNDLFVRLSSEVSTELSDTIPISIQIGESFSIGSPIISVKFRGDISQVSHLSTFLPSSLFYIDFGTSVERAFRFPVVISSVKMENTLLGRFKDIAFTVTFVSPHWHEFMNVKRNQGWSKKSFTTILQDIAKQSGFTEYDIESIRYQNEFIIQPHWSNFDMVKWIRKEASSQHKDHYEFYIDLLGRFNFKSISSLVEENFLSDQSQVPVIRMEGPIQNDRERSEAEERNNEFPPYFVKFKSNEHYMDSVLDGGGGFRTSWYDFETGKYHSSSIKLSQSGGYQLSDWAAIQTKHEHGSEILYGGRRNPENIALSKVSNSAFYTNTVMITGEGTIGARLGKVVNLTIPTLEHENNPYDVTRSGFYIISGIEHFIPLQNTTGFTTNLVLSRHGYDGKDLTGYSKTSKGKVVR